ncbi:MAG: sugar transferase [Tepidisphaeraceae bacterium]|jgi:lipopolysaccharide/colanic/teichoic acid biosynthesis glycosyltransferase
MIAQESAAVAVVREPHLKPVPASSEFVGIPARLGAVRAKPRPIHKLKNFHSRPDIDAILHRECSRCERNGHEFCLVVISAADNGARKHLHRVGKLLCRRARATDEIGWFDARRLCVVLPDTSTDGAMSFVRRFTEWANYHGLSPLCNLLSYRGQMHSDNEKLSVAQFAMGIEEAGQDLGPDARLGSTEADGRRDARSSSLRLHNAGDVAGLLVRPLPLWKRLIDITVGSIGLLPALPVMAAVALAIKASGPGPILFRQKRAGLGGKPFTIYKFRSMVVDAESKKAQLRHRSEQDGPAFKIRHDPRITRVGRFLRETSLDELPQLFNVLKGDMSLVGPRPLPVEESNLCATWHRRRLDVTPGLTCIWQIHGRSSVSFAEWIRMDRRYIRALSLWQDIKLILLTVPSILARRGR